MTVDEYLKSLKRKYDFIDREDESSGFLFSKGFLSKIKDGVVKLQLPEKIAKEFHLRLSSRKRRNLMKLL